MLILLDYFFQKRLKNTLLFCKNDDNSKYKINLIKIKKEIENEKH